jgi:hypothetical protein
MTRSVLEQVRVGSVLVPVATAQRWIRDYTNLENTTAANPYAYPAYDQYEKDRPDPNRLSDADLLAPGLLNVPIKIRSYYGLQQVRSDLEEGLANEDLDLPLAEVENPERVAAMVKPLYNVLDDPSRKPRNVKATTLSKVLHRKRPQSLVLHDIWVKACYLSTNGPVVPVKNRTWADYMTAITVAIGRDIRTQPEEFKLLAQAASSPGELTHVRLLDILAWKSKGSTPSEAAEDS